MKPQRILLIGYRGTGKSTVGKLLAARLGWSFVDADDELEREAQQSIAAIFASEGEAGFRDREGKILAQLCEREAAVIATGGGVILRPEHRQRLRNAGFVVWLTASPLVCWERLQQDRSTNDRRPNLTSQGGLAEVEAVLAYREPLYRETADLIVPTEEASPEQIADRIYSAYQKYRIENP
jgi:shikimate kinase